MQPLYEIPGCICMATPNLAATWDFQQCGIFTSVDSDEPVQPPFNHRNSKCCSVSSLTLLEYSSDQQRFWSDCTYAKADLRLWWSHIPHCWKCHVTAHMGMHCLLRWNDLVTNIQKLMYMVKSKFMVSDRIDHSICQEIVYNMAKCFNIILFCWVYVWSFIQDR